MIKYRRKTFKTIHQMSCFAGHPVQKVYKYRKKNLSNIKKFPAYPN